MSKLKKKIIIEEIRHIINENISQDDWINQYRSFESEFFRFPKSKIIQWKDIVLINRVLDVTHPRSNLAELFIEGDSKSLTYISNSE